MSAWIIGAFVIIVGLGVCVAKFIQDLGRDLDRDREDEE